MYSSVIYIRSIVGGRYYLGIFICSYYCLLTHRSVFVPTAQCTLQLRSFSVWTSLPELAQTSVCRYSMVSFCWWSALCALITMCQLRMFLGSVSSSKCQKTWPHVRVILELCCLEALGDGAGRGYFFHLCSAFEECRTSCQWLLFFRCIEVWDDMVTKWCKDNL